jgi:electron transfer flavoprotein beta subunit
VAKQLAEMAKNYDIIFAGIEASDYNGSAVGAMLAEILGFNSVSAVSGADIENDQLVVNREIDGGSQVLSVKTPVVLIVQKGIAKEPRIPAMRGIMMARTKPLNVVTPVEASDLTSFVSYELPSPRAACKKIAEENAKELITLLHEEAKAL